MNIMELNKTFIDGLWSKEINVSDFVSKNIAPYTETLLSCKDLPNVPNIFGSFASKHSKKKELTTEYVLSTPTQYQLLLHIRLAI